ncbi:CPCC family cysteine-rich protein, partial [Planktothricoides raciborskii]
MDQTLYPCPCCGYHTLTAPPPETYSICPICCWEDDGDIQRLFGDRIRACHQLEDLTKSRRNAEVEAENFLDHQVNYAPL